MTILSQFGHFRQKYLDPYQKTLIRHPGAKMSSIRVQFSIQNPRSAQKNHKNTKIRVEKIVQIRVLKTYNGPPLSDR